MEAISLYLLRVSVALTAFYLAYQLLFRKGKHFRFNRIYLGSSMVISYLIPLITIRKEAPVLIPDRTLLPANETISTAGNSIQAIPWELIAAIIFTAVLLGFAVKLAAGHLRAWYIIKRTEKYVMEEIRFRVSKEDIHPFSYFNLIVIPAGILKNPDLPIILQHEWIHVKEKHTIDVCVAELLLLFQWFNPFAWLMRNAVKNNLEYLTDDRIIQHADSRHYQLAMVTLAGKRGVPPFLNALNGSQLKKRIIMMKSKRKTKRQLIRKLLVLPLLTLLVLTLSNKEFRAQPALQGTKTITGKVTGKETGKPIPTAAVVIKGKPVGTITDAEGNYIINLDTADSVLVVSFPGYEKQEIKLDNRTRIDVILQQKPGTTHLTVNEAGNQPQREKPDVQKKEATKQPTENQIIIRNKEGAQDTIHPLFIIDGVKMKKGTTSKVMPPADQIESIEVLKKEISTSKYGPDAKEGVVIVTTKKKK